MHKTSILRYGLLYIPFLLASLFSNQYHASYLIAWLGTPFIFYLSYSGIIKEIPKDLKITEQLMRPLFLCQVIFSVYMCSTSIFHYLNTLGYEYLDFTGLTVRFNEDIFIGTAKAQRLYVLGHAAFVHGILATMNYTKPKRYIYCGRSKSNLLLGISLFTLPVAYLCLRIGALSQFGIQLSGLSFISGTIAMAFAIREQNKTNFIFAGGLFGFNLINSLSSGFKEPIIVCFIVLGVFLLPIYGKKVLPVFIVILTFLFLVLPSFMITFRSMVNAGEDAIEARNKSIQSVIEADKEDIEKGNWYFFVYRLSEIDMFLKYINSTPQYEPYYKLSIVNDAVKAVIPRAIWPEKPNIEQQVMDRVYKAGVVSQHAMVSAKPAYVVDGYLSYGAIGVWLALFIFGYGAQKISNIAESLFGGYFLGTAVMFSGLFQIFWRGNSFEFVLSSVLWSLFTMYMFFMYFRAKGIVVPRY